MMKRRVPAWLKMPKSSQLQAKSDLPELKWITPGRKMQYEIAFSGQELSILIRVIAAASEERFTRIKMDNSWPENAISYCLDYAGITLDEVDIIAYGWSAGFNAETHLLPYFDRI